MANAAPAFVQVFSCPSIVLLIGLLICSTLAERDGADRQCPDYVTRHALDGKQVPDIPALDLDNLEILNQFGDEVALTSKDDPTTYPAWLLGATPDTDGKIHNATPCVVILVEKNKRDVDAFYFYFYSYNEGPNVTQVLEPINRMVKGEKAASGMHFGDHIGDWLVLP
ncbi:vacuolar protein sorting-associated protein 62 [Colletotrichum tofieldiae]|nr:vacuolar protein sorting-associated protein 62 [Colletotrichum tofieldiae]GKT71155.1 vacuolar protein sorting-associated protein 62 [Colletotrichum tofieldiae]GKT93935.1 vacuolar protein sorting-associated protein 62 [Colletotrichum tofieldiae]